MLTKKETINAIAEKFETTKVEATKMYDCVFDTIQSLLEEGNEIAIPNVCRFKIKERAEREGRNPATGEAITIPATKAVSCSMAKNIKEAIKSL